MPLRPCVLFALLSACGPAQFTIGDKDSGAPDTGMGADDADGDGFAALDKGGEDCDDADALVNPDATESWYDSIDQDCDGWSDFDQDRDGEDITGFGADCDDTDPAIRTTATETRDLVDQDCDGLVDEDYIVAGAIVVSEVMQHPLAASDSDGEWIELQNTDSSSIDLRGWVLAGDDGDSFTISRSLVIPAGGHVVLGANDDAGLNGGIDVDYVYDRATFSLSAADNVFVLLGGATVFDVEWTAAWGTADGASWSLDPDHTGVADARQFDYWCVATSALPSGDFGSPGSRNDDCGKIDEDGDGYTVDEGDCDDDDAAVSPGADDTWDGLDNDCSGSVDDGVIGDVTTGYVDGASPNTYLALHSGLGLGAVRSGGSPDLLIGGAFQGNYAGAVYIIPGSDHDALGGTVTSFDAAAFAGAGYAYFGATSPLAGDNTGDGQADFVAAGQAYGAGGTAVVMFEGGRGVTGTLDPADADLHVTTAIAQTYSTGTNRVISYVDMDGDGVDEVVYSQPEMSSGTRYYLGRVSVYDAGSVRGEVDVADAALIIDGDSTQDYFGFGLGGGDIDGDGYDDLLVGAPGADDNATDGGAWYQIDGGTAWGGSVDVGDAEARTIAGDITSGGIGFGAPALGDYDDDGRLDLAFGGLATNTVSVFFALNRLSGSLDAEDADVQIEGDGPGRFGFTVASGDFDGDGVTDLMAGAPAVNSAYAQPSYWYYAPGNDVGRLYLFPGSSLTGGSSEASMASATVDGETRGDLFGSVLSGAADINGDGTDDLLVGAPRGGTNVAGRVYVVLGE
ncbi:MAG: MopE-related protein [Pseudomonadota bacterium]|nr:MopE-related protein [Pseudomonadota bacterium]